MGMVMQDGIHLPIRCQYCLYSKLEKGPNEEQAPKNVQDWGNSAVPWIDCCYHPALSYWHILLPLHLQP